MKYYIVFQERSGENFLWAPTKSSYFFFHKNVQEVRKGDVIFINHNAQIVGYSEAITDPYENYNENTTWDPNGHRVDIKVTPLDLPFKMKDYKDKVLEYKNKVEKYFPYNIDGNGNQGYLYEITEEFADFIKAIILEKENKKIESAFSKKAIVEEIDRIIENKNLVGKDAEAIVKIRINQNVFRQQLLNIEKKCKLCGLSNEKLLIASHIKPWSESSEDEKLHIHNGFLFCPHHDKLFDKFLISFEEDGRIIISEKLSKEDRILLNIREDLRIELNNENKKYLKWHRGKFLNKRDKL